MTDHGKADDSTTGDVQYVPRTLDFGSQVAEFDPSPYMRQLRGRGGSTTEYLDVKHRLLWLRTEHPDAEIVTELIRLDDMSAIFKATVAIPGGGRATGHGSETAKDFPDFIEKAETKALGRALNALGYGAQFADGEPEPKPAALPAAGAKEVRKPQRVEETPVRTQLPGVSPATSAKEDPPLEDYSWSAFWTWAKGQGYSTKDDVERAIGKSMNGMSPADVRKALRKPAR